MRTRGLTGGGGRHTAGERLRLHDVTTDEPTSSSDSWSAYLATESDRGFGDIELRKHGAISAFGTASSEAARNLLHKAQRALDDDDVERARGYVARAVQLPFDEAEGVKPVAWEGHMLLFLAVTDALEESDEDDPLWLDAALEVLATAEAVGRSTLASVLWTIGDDFQLTVRERKRLRQAVAGLPRETDALDWDAFADELTERVLEIVRTTNAYEDALDRLIG